MVSRLIYIIYLSFFYFGLYNAQGQIPTSINNVSFPVCNDTITIQGQTIFKLGILKNKSFTKFENKKYQGYLKGKKILWKRKYRYKLSESEFDDDKHYIFNMKIINSSLFKFRTKKIVSKSYIYCSDTLMLKTICKTHFNILRFKKESTVKTITYEQTGERIVEKKIIDNNRTFFR